jgi:hypothetical protein
MLTIGGTGCERGATPRDRLMLVGIAAMVALALGCGSRAADAPKNSLPQSQIPAWTDSMFSQPFIDIDEWRDKPVRHRYVHGGFKGTETLFSIYLPPKEQYQGRFFQPIMAIIGTENIALQDTKSFLPNVFVPSARYPDNTLIGFAAASGAYLVESNGGAKHAIGQSQDPEVNTVIGYRASAAVAQYSRVLAAQMYGPHRPYGYLYGGSGGSLKTVCAFENTLGVWDGAVPYVYGNDMNMPNAFTVQAYAHRILANKWGSIVDALDPGGSGDMYAGLNKEESDALREVTNYGFPPRTWFAYDRLGYGPLAWLINNLVRWDPQYFDDFWKVPGYLGANPPESLKRARIQQKTVITRVVMSDEASKIGLPLQPMGWAAGGKPFPAAIQVKNMSTGSLLGASVIMKSGPAAGKVFSVSSVLGDLISIGFELEQYPFVSGIRVGDEVQIDNSVYLAAQTYQRHQVPSPDYYGFNQYRGADGTPLYPQRPRLLGPDYNRGNSGCSSHSGWFSGKMIMVETLMDEYAYPWQADWYRSKVQQRVGSRLDDVFRTWYFDNAMHTAPQPGPDNTRLVQYTNALEQALRDLAAWVEKGIPPPASTSYRIVGGQVEVPPTAAERKGVQPVIILTVNGGTRVEVAVGQSVTFSGVVEVPPGTGKVVEAEWDFEGAGTYPVAGEIKPSASGARATVTTSYSFTKPGTYFPALRAASQRQPDSSPYGRIENLGRVRVVVK